MTVTPCSLAFSPASQMSFSKVAGVSSSAGLP